MVPEPVVVDGRFELRGPLGSGGMGTVWRAYDLVLYREVALKEVRPADLDLHRRGFPITFDGRIGAPGRVVGAGLGCELRR